LWWSYSPADSADWQKERHAVLERTVTARARLRGAILEADTLEDES
jgi:hypothetical protein